LMNASKNSCSVREVHLSPLAISHSFVTPSFCSYNVLLMLLR
jgi:hypothetical protein